MDIYLYVSSFSQDNVWQFLIQIFILLIALLLGNAIRRKVPIIKKSLIPSALIGGLLIILLKLFPWFNNLIDKDFMEIVTYHTLGLGFIAITLKTIRKNEKSTKTTIIETGALTASTYVIQGIVGLGASLIMFLLFDFFVCGGLLLPMGFGQGPGQALNFGTIYETEYGFVGGKSFGLTIATIGFLCACVIGVIYMNILKRKGKLTTYSLNEGKKKTLEDYETDNDIPDAESVDKLSIQLALVFGLYALTYLLMLGISKIPLGDFGIKTVQPLVWGFNFLWGVLFATIAKNLIKYFQKKKIINRNYTNNYLLDRISGFMFDLMIIAGIAAIDFNKLKDLWLPLIIICVLGTIVTFFFVLKACKHLYPTYQYEAFFCMFGMLTGTASNGIILLREIDPKFSTPASDNLVFQNFPAIVFGFPILLLLNFAPKGLTQSIITLIILIVLFTAFYLFIFRKKIFNKHYN